MNIITDNSFGRHVRSLRRARGLTQEELAERCGLSPDTIRRLEHGSFSPSLDTLRKLCAGLDMLLSTLFEGYELGKRSAVRDLLDAIERLAPKVRQALTSFVQALADDDG